MKKRAALLLLLLTCCTPPRQGPLEREGHAQAVAQRSGLQATAVQVSGLSHYRFTYRVQCVCPPEMQTPVQVEVRAQKVVGVRDLGSGRQVPPERYSAYFTLERVQNTLRQAQARVRSSAWLERVEVTYHPGVDYPRTIHFVARPGYADSDSTYTIGGLQVLEGESPAAVWRSVNAALPKR